LQIIDTDNGQIFQLYVLALLKKIL